MTLTVCTISMEITTMVVVVMTLKWEAINHGKRDVGTTIDIIKTKPTTE